MSYINEQDRLIWLLTDELPVLRARLKISQDELSRRVGISRQTYSLIETKKQKMTWVTFMAMIAFFENNAKTKVALESIGLTTDDAFRALLQK
jgi:DNA-binding XRE family transcriptional regulator